MIQRKMLFSPGPVLTSDRVKSALSHPDMCHRHPAFEHIVEGIRAKLLELVGANEDYVAVVVTGSGTAANEVALSSLIKDSDRVLLIKNGEFGERLEEILSCYGYNLRILSTPWGALPDLDTVESVLAEGSQTTWVCIVMHETSTGMLNPVREVGELAERHGASYFVDCISAVGGEDIDVLRDGIDVCTGVPNKAVGGLPGVSFVVASRGSVPDLGEVPRRNIYLNLQTHIAVAEKRSQTPNTPAVSGFVALDAALDELLEEGLETRRARYRACAQTIRDGIKKLGLEVLVPEELSANTVTSVFLPRELDLDEFIENMDKRGYIIYPGKRHLREENMFQIANMGRLNSQDCRDLLRVLEDVLDAMMPAQ